MLGLCVGWLGGGISWLETFGAGTSLLGIQYLLLNTHKARKVLPLEVVPSQSEIYAAVACFWVAYLGSIKTLLHAVNFIFWLLPSFEREDEIPLNTIPKAVGRTSSGPNFVLQLLNLVILTWQFHQSILFILETAIPFLSTLTTTTQFSPTLQYFQTRLNALTTFLRLITTGHPTPTQKYFQNPPPPFSLTSSSTQITLQRTRTPSQNHKERTLSWALTIPPILLDEMKETLGPPGGFGELGFCVGKSEVRFEGMGVGTSFGLVFDVEIEDGKEFGGNGGDVKDMAVKESEKGRAKKAESRRRKTK